jgi:hypothetical protein
LTIWKRRSLGASFEYWHIHSRWWRDGTQFATRQRRFQQVAASVAQLITRPNNGVRLINKQQHRHRGVAGLDDVFQTLFEFPLHRRPPEANRSSVLTMTA